MLIGEMYMYVLERLETLGVSPSKCTIKKTKPQTYEYQPERHQTGAGTRHIILRQVYEYIWRRLRFIKMGSNPTTVLLFLTFLNLF